MRRIWPFLVVLFISCQFDRSDRWALGSLIPKPTCVAGTKRCNVALEICSEDAHEWSVVDDCSKRGLQCSASLAKCTRCEPGAKRCEGQASEICNADGH